MRMLKYEHNGEVILAATDSGQAPRICLLSSSIHCQVVSREASGQALLAAHYRVDGHPFINPIQVNTAFE